MARLRADIVADEHRRNQEQRAAARQQPLYTMAQVQDANRIVFGNQVNFLRKETDIKRAFHDASKRLHPDKNQGNDEAFKALKPAYDLLLHVNKYGIWQ